MLERASKHVGTVVTCYREPRYPESTPLSSGIVSSDYLTFGKTRIHTLVGRISNRVQKEAAPLPHTEAEKRLDIPFPSGPVT